MFFGIKASPRLFRYVLAETLPFVLLTLIILTALILAQQVSRQSDFLFSSTASFILSLRVIFSLLPSVLVITLPFSLLIGALMALNRLSSDSEVIAAQASGISLLRLCSPLLFCGLIGVGISSYLTIKIIPERLSDAKLAKNELLLLALTIPIKPQSFNTHFPNYLIYIRDIEKGSGDWQGVFIVRKASESHPDFIVLTANRARLRMTQISPIILELDMIDGMFVTLSDLMPEKQTVVRFAHQEIKLSSEMPSVAQSIDRTRSSQELPFLQLFEKSKRGETSLEKLQAQVEWHKRLSLPMACFTLILLAIPLGTKTTRQTGRAVAFTLGFGLAITYYLILLAGQNLALSRDVPVWIGVWLPNIIGLAAYAYLNYAPPSFLPSGINYEHWKSIPGWFPARLIHIINKSLTTARSRLSKILARLYSPFFPSLINYLLLSELIKFLFLSAAILLSTSLLFTLFDLLPSLSRSGLGWQYAGVYLLYLSPQILYYICPFALLLAVLITHGTLSRSHQITAMLMGGQSYIQLALPFILTVLLTIVGLFWLSEKVLPTANQEQDARFNHIKGKKTEQAILALGQRWVQGENGTIYAYHYDNRNNALLNTTAYNLSKATGLLQEIIQAKKTTPITDSDWNIIEGWKMTLNSDLQVEFRPITPTLPQNLRIPDTNAIFNRVINEASKMGFYELRQHIHYLSKLNAPTTSLRVDLEKKLAFPFSCLPLLALAIPLAIKNSQRKTLAGIGFSIIIGLAYWISASLFESLGRQAFLPPGLSVWGPLALFTASGIFISFRLRK